MDCAVSLSPSSTDTVNTPTIDSYQLESIANAMDVGSPLNVFEKNLFQMVQLLRKYFLGPLLIMNKRDSGKSGCKKIHYGFILLYYVPRICEMIWFFINWQLYSVANITGVITNIHISTHLTLIYNNNNKHKNETFLNCWEKLKDIVIKNKKNSKWTMLSIEYVVILLWILFATIFTVGRIIWTK